MSFKLHQQIKNFLPICSLMLIALSADCEAFENRMNSKYKSIRELYPKVANSESSQWRMSDTEDFKKHPCQRECVANQPMTCYYYMVVHYDDTMGPGCDRYLDAKYRFKVDGIEYIDSTVYDFNGYDDCKYADGLKAEVLVVNGQLPGQPIEVCDGDTVVADVINSMLESTTVHWHGMHQRKTPHMDGVPHVTQYPIEGGQAFRYRFEVDHVGTNWWHSHTEHQRAFGLAGAMIVRQPSEQNVHASMYDFDYSDHIIMVQDWVDNFYESVPHNILINGLGRNLEVNSRATNPTLYSTFSVVQGGRYRFRVIFNGVANCPITLSIDTHDLVVISSDGNDIEPITVQKITFHGAERFDFVLHANQRIDNYWLRIKGSNFCAFNRIHQEAIIHYAGANKRAIPKAKPSYTYERQGIELNPVDEIPNENAQSITIVEMNAKDLRLEPPLTPHRTFYTSMAVNNVSVNNNIRSGLIFQMDDITFHMPKMSLLQTRNLDIGRYFCDKAQQAAQGSNCRSKHCQCTNVIQVPAFKNVEFVISSTSDTAHPIHLHGYTFRVVGMGVLGNDRIRNIETIDRLTPLPRRARGAPRKDSVQVPAFGYTIIRFHTDNPGYWMFHCHISTHSENGMAAVVRVGEDEQMKMCPVSNCGLCNSLL